MDNLLDTMTEYGAEKERNRILAAIMRKKLHLEITEEQLKTLLQIINNEPNFD